MAKVKGLCKNIDECSMAENREVQEVEKSAQFVCAECGKPLVAQKGKESGGGKGMPKWLIPAVAAVVVIGGGVAGWLLMGNDMPDQEIVDVPSDNPTIEDPVPTPPEPIKTNLEYGDWSGELVDGKPTGSGTMTYSKHQLIDSRDPKKRYAESGDKLIGEYNNGRLIQGKLYRADGNIEAILIGQ